ncbi:MAG: (5-formylfuran-3-yl)methyl phosphate synthase [Chloroflexi bacterium]|nr:(5-formylfuran-3-yl)methyl phosphate synthase [Chloroflexota bacterium]
MRLLISVVSADEAREAIAGGADILDVKNPAEGSLGAHFPRVIQEVRAITPRWLAVSAAIGDMPNLPGTAALAALGAATCGADYVKVGLWGPKSQAEAVVLLQEVQRAVSAFPGVMVIAAGYADAQRAGGTQPDTGWLLPPTLLPRIAQAAGVAGCMLDTAIKDGRRLFDFLSPETLQALAAEAHAAGLLFALAGALQEQDLPLIRDLGADVAGVRSAACRGGRRAGPLDTERVRRLREVIALPLRPAAQRDGSQGRE